MTRLNIDEQERLINQNGFSTLRIHTYSFMIDRDYLSVYKDNPNVSTVEISQTVSKYSCHISFKNTPLGVNYGIGPNYELKGYELRHGVVDNRVCRIVKYFCNEQDMLDELYMLNGKVGVNIKGAN